MKMPHSWLRTFGCLHRAKLPELIKKSQTRGLNLSLAPCILIEQMYEPFDSESSWEEPPSALPPGLGEMEPGLELARVLAGLESSSLTSFERVRVIAACRKMVSHYQALSSRELWSLLHEEFDRDREEARTQGVSPQPEDALFFVTTEIGAALHLTTRAAEIEVNRALGLERAPSVFEALLRGKLDLYRAGVLIDRTSHLPAPDLTWVLSQVVAEAEGLTASQIRVRVDRLCYLADPEEAKLRYGEAVKNRMVEVRETSSAPPPSRAMTFPPTGPRLPTGD